MRRSGATDPCRYIERTLPETGRLIIRRVSHLSPSIPVKSPQLVLALLALLAPSFTGCASTTPGAPNDSAWSGVIDADDPRSVGARAVLEAYVANDPESMADWFADDAEIRFNQNTYDKETFLAGVPERHEQFEIALEDTIVTTMLYNNGKVFTNLWTTWTGVARSSGERTEIPVQMYMTWEDGKITEFMHFLDPGPLEEAIEAL